MTKLRNYLAGLLAVATLFTLFGANAAIVNIDFKGVRIGDEPLPLYVGVGPVGSGTIWNGIPVDSKLDDGSNNDNLAVSASNLLDDNGVTTTVGFTIGPVGGDSTAATATEESAAALEQDYIFNNSAGNSVGAEGSPFTITGLGNNTTVDLYFFVRGGQNQIRISGLSAGTFTDAGIFTSGNTIFFDDVPVTGGTVSGFTGDGTAPVTAVIRGFTIAAPGPFGALTTPRVKSTSPSGTTVRANAMIAIELEDSSTQVATNSIQVFLNGQAVSPAISKPAGANVTTVSYDPPGNLPESTNTVRVIFSNNASPAVLQTNQFSFVVINDAAAALIVNLDMNGQRTGDEPGPTFVGQGAAGGGSVFNGLTADSRDLSSGTDNDNIAVSGTNLLDSIGGATTVGFTIAPVGGDNNGAGTNATATTALLGDYVFVGSAGQTTGRADFTISGLGTIPAVDLYFYFGANGDFAIPGASPAPFSGVAPFTSANTRFFKSVPVSGGTLSGTFGTGPVGLIYGLTIKRPAPGAFVKSTSPSGTAVRDFSAIGIELLDYITQVATNSIQLSLNGQTVTPTVSKPAGTTLTTISYDPPGALPESTNTVRLIFSDNSAPAVFQTNEFSFVVISEANATRIVNVDFNGARNIPGPDALGPTYVGQGPAGGGSTWNGVTADSRLSDGTDEDNLTVEGTNFLDSVGGATTVSFTISPVGGDVGGAPTTAPASSAALLSDYIFNNSAGNVAGQSPFTISGLGAIPTADVYFIFGAGTISIPGSTRTAYTPRGIFTAGNVFYFKSVPVSGGTISGLMGPGVTVINGMSIVKPLPQPFVRSTSPTGRGVRASAVITIELQDYVTQVASNSIQLVFNGQTVSPIISKPPGTNLTTVTFDPPGDLPSESTNTVRLIFSDTSATPVVQTIEFSFVSEQVLPFPPRLQDSGADGLLVLEAEHADANLAGGESSWSLTTASNGFSGEGAMQAVPDVVNRNVQSDISASPRLDFKVNFARTGTHYLWVRGIGDGAPGPSEDDSVHVGLDDVLPATSARISGFPQGAGYVWSNGRVDPAVDGGPPKFEVNTLGEHRVTVWMRENGFIFDKLLITTSSNYIPTGLGPAGSRRGPSGIVNIDLNGRRNVPGPDPEPPTYIGLSAVGVGTIWNGVTADSRLQDGTDDDNLTVSGTNLVDSLGGPTTVSFTISPVGGDNGGSVPAETSPAALQGDYVFINSAGNNAGMANFTISGLGTATTADLYFYFAANGTFSVGGPAPAIFRPTGIFTAANTRFFSNVPVSAGTITGTFGNGSAVGVLHGLTIARSAPAGLPGPLSIVRQGNNVVISWPGTATLQSADNVTGPWVNVSGATSPQTVTPSGTKFYRLTQ